MVWVRVVEDGDKDGDASGGVVISSRAAHVARSASVMSGGNGRRASRSTSAVSRAMAAARHAASRSAQVWGAVVVGSGTPPARPTRSSRVPRRYTIVA